MNAGPSDRYDIFVSYARSDNAGGWITQFVERIQEEHRQYSGGREFRVFFDKTDIRSLDDWRHRIYESVAASRLLVVFVSPAYFASAWCRKEWHTWIDVEIAKHVLSDGAAPIYIVEVPWLSEDMTAQQVEAEIARLLHRPADAVAAGEALAVALQVSERQLTQVRAFFDAGVAALRREDLRNVLATLARDLSKRSEHVEAAARSQSTVPPYNRRFVGRLCELESLRDQLHQGRTGVIAGYSGDLRQAPSRVAGVQGLGGIGKTELAFTYAHAFAGLYPGGRFLVPCDGRADLRQAMLALDEVFRVEISDEQRKGLDFHFAAIRDCLRQRLGEFGRVLLILDNVADRALLSPEQLDHVRTLGPGVHLLITTRLGAPQAVSLDDIHWVTLAELSTLESLRLLEKHRSFPAEAEQTAAERIARRLGGFALCVEIVGAYLSQHPEQSYAGFLQTMGLDDLEQVDYAATSSNVITRRHNNEKRLGAILVHTLADVPAQALTALRFAALLPPDQVVVSWLHRLVAGKYPALADDVNAWQQVVAQLISLSLLTRQQNDDTGRSETGQSRIMRCHRLLQAYMRESFVAGEAETSQLAVDSLVTERGSVVEVTRRWDEANWELEPLDAIANLWADNERGLAPALLSRVGARWHELAEWAKAEPLFRRALAIDSKTLGPNHPDVARDLSNLGQLMRVTNRLAEAEPLMRQSIGIDEAAFGATHPNVATRLGNLAELLAATNRYAEAESLVRRAVEIDRAAQGPRHPSMAIRLNNLADILRATGRATDAEPLLWAALAIDKNSLGPHHPNVAIRLGNLSMILLDTNRATEAEPLIREALSIDERNFGIDHPRVGRDLNNLNGVLQALDRVAEAEPLIRRALAIDEKSYGPDHLSVAIRLTNLANLLDSTGRQAEAEPLLRRALTIDEKSYGPDHPAVSQALNNLAILLSETNRRAEAEPLLRRALEILLRSLAATGHKPARFDATFGNYAGLLEECGLTHQQIRSKLNEIGEPYDLRV